MPLIQLARRTFQMSTLRSNSDQSAHQSDVTFSICVSVGGTAPPLWLPLELHFLLLNWWKDNRCLSTFLFFVKSDFISRQPRVLRQLQFYSVCRVFKRGKKTNELRQRQKGDERKQNWWKVGGGVVVGGFMSDDILTLTRYLQLSQAEADWLPCPQCAALLGSSKVPSDVWPLLFPLCRRRWPPGSAAWLHRSCSQCTQVWLLVHERMSHFAKCIKNNNLKNLFCPFFCILFC